jgi:hypothetical protein
LTTQILYSEKIYFDISEQGHRSYYAQVILKELDFSTLLESPQKSFMKLLKCRQLICGTIDDYLLFFFFISFLRWACGKTTVGLTIRAETILDEVTFKRIVKALMLRFMKRFSGLNVLTLMSFEVEPELARYCKDWIFDLQLWDLEVLYPNTTESVSFERLKAQILKSISNKKPILLLPGRQSLVKGHHFLFQNCPQWSKYVNVVLVGPIWDLPPEKLEQFRNDGGFVFDVELSDSDLVSLMKFSDYVWCCYREDYNQSSGIWGRSVQLSKKFIVRRNSRIDFFSQNMNLEFNEESWLNSVSEGSTPFRLYDPKITFNVNKARANTVEKLRKWSE